MRRGRGIPGGDGGDVGGVDCDSEPRLRVRRRGSTLPEPSVLIAVPSPAARIDTFGAAPAGTGVTATTPVVYFTVLQEFIYAENGIFEPASKL